MIKYIYSYVFYFYTRQDNNSESISWMYTVMVIGHFFSINIMSVLNILRRHVEVGETIYCGTWIFLNLFNSLYFFKLNKGAKEKLIIDKAKVPKYSGLVILMYIVFTHMMMLDTV